MNFTLTPVSPLSRLISPRVHSVCGSGRGDNSPENYSEQPAVSESHHRNLSTSVILAPASYGAPNISMKRVIAQLSHPRL